MVIMIWIQTGFSMVILSAAIKAVPTELIEAAKIDGATDSQAFWRVILPQIATTIGVVVTTLIVGVMKVFDIVKVTTNGQFDTQVLANNMFDEAFNRVNIGKGAALAMLIFLSVLPVMVFNIRKHAAGELSSEHHRTNRQRHRFRRPARADAAVRDRSIASTDSCDRSRPASSG